MTMTETEQIPSPTGSAPAPSRVQETPLEVVASLCLTLVVGLFALTFLGQNFVIPSGSMENALLVGDHLLVDRITLAPPAKWMPLVHYREPRRGDVVVFFKPGELDADGKPKIMFLVKRLIGMPGDHIHLHNGIVSINGVAQAPPATEKDSPTLDQAFLDEFPSIAPSSDHGSTERWAVDFPNHLENGDLMVPDGEYFMMGDHRHRSLDSRSWGFVPRENIIGRPLFNFWSFVSPETEDGVTGVDNNIAWAFHVVTHFFSDTRWRRTLHLIR
jgi:signal peptidase I